MEQSPIPLGRGASEAHTLKLIVTVKSILLDFSFVNIFKIFDTYKLEYWKPIFYNICSQPSNILESLRERIISYNFQTDKEEEHKYTCELNKEWTPFNSNLHMQGIKVSDQQIPDVP